MSRLVLALMIATAILIARLPGVEAQDAECSPGPGQITNVFVDVESVSTDGFTGPSSSTLNRPTGETVVVDSSAVKEWLGAVQSNADVMVGMRLQVVGLRQEDCSILAVRIFSPIAKTDCSPGPGPGHQDEVFIDVQSVSADGFMGPASDTAGQPTGETVTVTVDFPGQTQWHGAVQSSADVMVGMRLRVSGPRQEDCSIHALDVFSTIVDLPATGVGPERGSSGQEVVLAALAASTLLLLSGLATYGWRRSRSRP